MLWGNLNLDQLSILYLLGEGQEYWVINVMVGKRLASFLFSAHALHHEPSGNKARMMLWTL